VGGRRILRPHWKWLSILVATSLFILPLLIVGCWEPLLIDIGQWLVVEILLREADLAIDLGGGRGRQAEAARLFKERLSQWVLFVGSHVRPQGYRHLGVPAERAVPMPPLACTTYEEAIATHTVVQGRSFKPVLIVTSPYHMRRVRLTFERVFRGTDVALLLASAPDQIFLIDAWRKSHIGQKVVLREYLGLVYYWLMVWGK
jgi:uncharacterized SAM-binding protein YcdF (DUF218 family)